MVIRCKSLWWMVCLCTGHSMWFSTVDSLSVTTFWWRHMRWVDIGQHRQPCLGLTHPEIRRIITVRRYAFHGLSYRNSVRLSVRLSVTHVHCVHMVRPTIMISSPRGSSIILVSGDIKFISKFEGGHPERGRWMRVGWVRIGDMRPISRRISKTVRDTTKVRPTISH